jgi:hypothetical protein
LNTPEWSGNLTGVKEFNRLRLTGKLDSKDFDYDDARNIAARARPDNRDRDEFYYGGKAEYAVSPDTASSCRWSATRRNYDTGCSRPQLRAVPLSPRPRVTRTVTPPRSAPTSTCRKLLRGEVEGGYMSQSYDNCVADIDGFSAKGRVEWFPTELTTLNVAGSRSIEESVAIGLARLHLEQRRRSASITSCCATSCCRPKPLRQGQLRDDRSRRQAHGLQRLGRLSVNRNVGLFLTYNYLKQNSDRAPPRARRSRQQALLPLLSVALCSSSVTS